MPAIIDLHMHTSHSDGVLSTSELLALVRQKELKAFSITDHDTIAGFLEAKSLLNDSDPELVAGVELSVAAGDSDLHLLAYLFDSRHNGLKESLHEFQQHRNRRGRQMVEKLRQQGLDITFEAVERAAGGSVIGRPHVADAMLELGLVNYFEEAFDKYIGNNGPAYVRKSRLEPETAIKLVHDAGGVTVLAHPFISDMYQHLESLCAAGLDGLEVYHYSHRTHQVRQAKRWVTEYGLLPLGGSDFHGRSEREGEIGSLAVPYDYLIKLKERAEQIRGTN